MKHLLLITSLLSLTKQGNSFTCYTTDPIKEDETCNADAELCFELATTADDNPENCVYRRGCIQEQIQFPNQEAIDYLVKEPSGLFQVCAGDKCNNKRQSCNPQNYKELLETCNIKVANQSDTSKKKQKVVDDLSKEINSMKEQLAAKEAQNEENGNTKSAGTGVSGLAIAFIIISVILLVGLIVGVIFHMKKVKQLTNSGIQMANTTNEATITLM